MPGKWSKNSSWPEGSRECRACFKIKSFEEFDNHRQGYCGKYTKCKSCRPAQSKVQWLNKDYQLKMFDRAKTRATKKGLEFNIEISDIIIPEFCPILGFKLSLDASDPRQSPSIDRIDSSKGYVKGNIQVISTRANTLKNNAELWELIAVIKSM